MEYKNPVAVFVTGIINALVLALTSLNVYKVSFPIIKFEKKNESEEIEWSSCTD